ncbi:MAG: DUF423 domain-containing protein, partial [Actinomycetota bacterium]
SGSRPACGTCSTACRVCSRSPGSARTAREGSSRVIGGWAFGLGILLFSGSLIALALTGNPRWGAVTPVGGVLLLVGWASVVAIGILLPGGTGSTAYLVSC